jgi:hypothetical protein
MAGTKAVTLAASTPDQSNVTAKCDPLTKWATGAILLFITLATFNWLDTIKVPSFLPSLSVSRKRANPFYLPGSMVCI